MIHALALLIGIVAGLRTFTAPAAVAWAVHLGWIPLQDTHFAFLGQSIVPWALSLMAIIELVTDKLPVTPSRKIPMAFGARILSGGFSGAALGASAGGLAAGLILGVAGTVAGTLGGYAFRMRLAAFFDNDLPAALIEDLIAVGGAFLIAQMPAI